MSFLFQRALKSSAEYSVALLKQIREGEEDYEQLQSNYNAALDNRRQLLGDALFLYLASINEITDSEGKLTENEKIEVERYVEMINLATFAFHVFYAMEIETCLSAFFRTFAPLINDYCSAERNMYTILRMALFRQRIIASNNIELEIGSIIDKTFPSKDFTTYYFRTDAPYNEKTIEWLLELRNEVLDIPVETLDPEDFAGEEAIRERLTEFIGFRYDYWYEHEAEQDYESSYDIEQGLEDWKPTGENNHQDSNEQSRQTLILPPRFHRSQEPKTDENERSRKRLARSPCSDWSQTSDGEDEDERPRKRAVNSPYSNRSQISDEDEDEQEQSCKRSIFSPDPSARALSATEADFDEDVVRRIYEEVDELEEESISAPSPAPLESKGTQTSPSLSPTRIALPSPPASARRILPLNTSGQRNRIEATSPTSTSHSQELHNTNHRLVQSPSSSSRNLPLSFGRNAVPVIANNIDLTNNPPARMIRTKTGKLQKAPKVRSASVPWTEEEVRALEENVALHGSAWALILTTDTRLRAHTDAQLKDKATNEIKKRLKLSQDHPQLGGFAAIYNPKRKYI